MTAVSFRNFQQPSMSMSSDFPVGGKSKKEEDQALVSASSDIHIDMLPRSSYSMTPSPADKFGYFGKLNDSLGMLWSTYDQFADFPAYGSGTGLPASPTSSIAGSLNRGEGFTGGSSGGSSQFWEGTGREYEFPAAGSWGGWQPRSFVERERTRARQEPPRQWQRQDAQGAWMNQQATAYRSAASKCLAKLVWCGVLLPRDDQSSSFSCKVFLGGLPWDVTDQDLKNAFMKFGSVRVEWPLNNHEIPTGRSGRGHAQGYVYIIFDNERAVRALLGSCKYDTDRGINNFYYRVGSARMSSKYVQVIPWQISNASYVRDGSTTCFTPKTVFVGSLHGVVSAEGLARVMNELFGNVIASSIDTDKNKYPIGSGRVLFSSDESYSKAIKAAFVDLRTPHFSKKIQIDPYLEDSNCSVCGIQIGPYFCRDPACFTYFCSSCWNWRHTINPEISYHTPMARGPKTH